MNVLELMDLKVSSFSKTERSIYEGIKKFPDQFAKSSISDISSHSGFTKPSLTRFAQKLGFSGYAEFQYQFNIDLQETSSHPKSSLSKTYGLLLKQTEETVTDEVSDKIVDMILSANNLYLTGASLCRLVAEELEIVLRLTSNINVIRPSIDSMPLKYKEDDLLIVYSSLSGSSHTELLKYLRKDNIIKPHMLLVTTNAKHPLRHNFEEMVILPSTNISNVDNSPISDTFAYLFFNEMIIQKIKKR